MTDITAADVQWGHSHNDNTMETLIMAGRTYVFGGVSILRLWSAALPPPLIITELNQTAPIIFSGATSVILLPNSTLIISLPSDSAPLDIDAGNTSGMVLAPIRASECIQLNGSIVLVFEQSQFPKLQTRYLLVSSPCITGKCFHSSLANNNEQNTVSNPLYNFQVVICY